MRKKPRSFGEYLSSHPPKLIWITAGLMLSALAVVVIGFILRAFGVWNDFISKCLLAIVGIIFLAAVLFATAGLPKK